jgi:hypothetical protein
MPLKEQTATSAAVITEEMEPDFTALVAVRGRCQKKPMRSDFWKSVMAGVTQTASPAARTTDETVSPTIPTMRSICASVVTSGGAMQMQSIATRV